MSDESIRNSVRDVDGYDDYLEIEEQDYQIDEYDLISSPNDFNVLTIVNFMQSGVVKIPGFQRNYVWDIKRASKLIESIILGLPIPQIFLYEESRNSFLVIDGQQRMLSLYFFVSQRFPRRDKRAELRSAIGDGKGVDESILNDDRYFTKFNLSLPKLHSGSSNKFSGLNYSTLGEYRQSFELRTIRNIIIKQLNPRDDDSSIHEIFHRLNSGGMNLSPQEIRSSLYHSNFYNALFDMNRDPRWRRILGDAVPDLRMKDVEVILRGFALLVDGDDYASSMTKFLDSFSKSQKLNSESRNRYLLELFESFLDSIEGLTDRAFRSDNGKFNVPLYEAVFAASCWGPYRNDSLVQNVVTAEMLSTLRSDPEYADASFKATANKSNVDTRLRRARMVLQ